MGFAILTRWVREEHGVTIITVRSLQFSASLMSITVFFSVCRWPSMDCWTTCEPYRLHVAVRMETDHRQRLHRNTAHIYQLELR